MLKITRKNTVLILSLVLLLICVYKADSLITILWDNSVPLILKIMNRNSENCVEEDIEVISIETKTEENKEVVNVRNEILIKAKEIWTKYGNKGLRIDNFAKHANVNPEVIRNIFHDNVGLYAALMRREAGRIGCKSGFVSRILPSTLVVLFWFIFGYIVQKMSTTSKMGIAPVNLLSCIGWSIMLLYVFAVNEITLTGTNAVFIVVFPIIAWLSFLIWFTYRNEEIRKVRPNKKHYIPIFYKTLFIIVILLFFIKLFDVLIWNILAKGTPVGDEYIVWQTSITRFRLQGFGKLSSFSHAPAYPVISNLLLFIIPVKYIFGASYAVPFLFGSFLIWIIIAGNNKNYITLAQFFFCTLCFPLIFFSHDWIHRMFFTMWYGEAMAVLIIASVFMALDSRDEYDKTSLRTRSIAYINIFGLGMLSSASKPPFSILVVWAFVPGIIITSFLFKQKSEIYLKSIIFGLGALLLELLKNNITKRMIGYEIQTVYNVADWDFKLVIDKLIPYFLTGYEQCWVPFVILVTIAVIMNKKHLPFILVSIGLSMSIIVLYATMWQNKYIDYESGGRYIIHGLYGWMLYFLAIKRNILTKIVFDATQACYFRTYIYFRNRLFSEDKRV